MSAPHGTATRYEGGCSCPACRKANRDRIARRTRTRVAWVREHGLPDGIEHGASAYNNWGCRCDICRAGAAARGRAYYDKRNSR